MGDISLFVWQCLFSHLTLPHHLNSLTRDQGAAGLSRTGVPLRPHGPLPSTSHMPLFCSGSHQTIQLHRVCSHLECRWTDVSTASGQRKMSAVSLHELSEALRLVRGLETPLSTRAKEALMQHVATQVPAVRAVPGSAGPRKLVRLGLCEGGHSCTTHERVSAVSPRTPHTHPPIPVPLIPAAASASHDDTMTGALWMSSCSVLGEALGAPQLHPALCTVSLPALQHLRLRHPIACLVLLPRSFPSAQLLALPGFWKHPLTRTTSLA